VLGSLLYGPLKILQQYTVVPCKHKRPVLPFNCLRKMALATKKGKEKYFIATQASSSSVCVCARCGLLLHISATAWSVCLSLCVFGTQMSCAKTGELIEMSFGNRFVSARRFLIHTGTDNFYEAKGSLFG